MCEDVLVYVHVETAAVEHNTHTEQQQLLKPYLAMASTHSPQSTLYLQGESVRMCTCLSMAVWTRSGSSPTL